MLPTHSTAHLPRVPAAQGRVPVGVFYHNTSRALGPFALPTGAQRLEKQRTKPIVKGTSMRKKSYLVAATFLAAALGVAAPRAEAHQPSAAVIIEWNQLLQQNLAGPPFVQVRTYAMMHIAMADAVVAIQGRYDPYHVRLWAYPAWSAEAAAAQAAHDILVALIPSGQAAFDAALAARLATIHAGRNGGVLTGKKVAAEVLAWRQNDGSATANPQPPDFLASTFPVSGDRQPGPADRRSSPSSAVQTRSACSRRHSSCRSRSRSWKALNTPPISTK